MTLHKDRTVSVGVVNDLNLSLWLGASLVFSALWAPHSCCRHCCPSWTELCYPAEWNLSTLLPSLEASQQFHTSWQLQGACWGLSWLWVGWLQQIWARKVAWAVLKQKSVCSQSCSVKPSRTPQENCEILHGFSGAGFHRPGQGFLSLLQSLVNSVPFTDGRNLS